MMVSTIEACKPLVDRITATSGSGLSVDQRRDATRQLLGAIESYASPNKQRQGITDQNDAVLLQAVVALKLLGREVQGTEDLAAEQGLRLLLHLSELDTRLHVNTADSDNLSPVRNEAIRCLANVCLLHESARIRLGAIKDVTEAILAFGQTSNSMTSRFLAARLLFLLTASGGEVVRLLVEDLNIAGHLSQQLSLFASDHDITQGRGLSETSVIALAEYLKTIFNIALHYPRYRSASPGQKTAPIVDCAAVKSEQSTKNSADRLSPPPRAGGLMRRPSSSASTSSSRSAGSSDLRSRSPSPSPSQGHGSPKQNATKKLRGLFDKATGRKRSADGHVDPAPAPGKDATILKVDDDVLARWGFSDVVTGLVKLALCLPYGDGPLCGPFDLHKHLVTALLNIPLAAYHDIVFTQIAPSNIAQQPPMPSSSPTKATPRIAVLPGRLLTLLDQAMKVYSPFSFDDAAARQAVLAAPESLDETFSFLLLLLAKFAAEDSVGDTRRAMRSILLADDIDRSIGLEQRQDLTGRLVRCMGSSYMPSCNDAAGKLLFAICDQDPALFSSIVGYGNAAGFLRSIGMLIPPSNPSAVDDQASYNSAAINPITGALDDPTLLAEVNAMTEEEKEREAERLFVLFDRMNKNGAISIDNPVRAAHQTGKLESTAAELNSDAERFQELEDEEEMAALAELQRYKERKSRRP